MTASERAALVVQSTSLFDRTALAYAARHWRIFPCEPGSKKPLGRLVRHGAVETRGVVSRPPHRANLPVLFCHLFC